MCHICTAQVLMQWSRCPLTPSTGFLHPRRMELVFASFQEPAACRASALTKYCRRWRQTIAAPSPAPLQSPHTSSARSTTCLLAALLRDLLRYCQPCWHSLEHLQAHMLALATKKKSATKPWTLHGSREIQGQGWSRATPAPGANITAQCCPGGLAVCLAILPCVTLGFNFLFPIPTDNSPLSAKMKGRR